MKEPATVCPSHSVPQTSKHLRVCVQAEGFVQTEGKCTELKSLVPMYFLLSHCLGAWISTTVWVDESVPDGTHPAKLLYKSERKPN